MYNHGVYIDENPTTFEQPLSNPSHAQVVFGTAPINLLSDPSSAVNTPILVQSFEDAKQKLGYSDDWTNYTLCESMYATFRVMKVAPVVFINVLDPSTHTTSTTDTSLSVQNQEAKLEEKGVLLNTVEVKDEGGTTTYVKDSDYLIGFDADGQVMITLLTGGQAGSATTVQVSYDQLDPTAVSATDVIGGYNDTTNSYSGLELISQVYPKLGVLPSILLAPGYSQDEQVGTLLVAKSSKINGSFNATNVLDLEGATKEEAIQDKESKSYTSETSSTCWPKAKYGSRVFWYSSLVGAAIARVAAENNGVPYKSPSNNPLPISAMVNSDGQEMYLDQVQANELNSKGIVTAINMNGWRVWGNNTAAYDDESPVELDPKDRFLAVRRMFDWWGNSFILNYFDRVDDPTNYRLIESVVDSENIRANGLQARGQIAGAQIEFRKSDNPVGQILDGKIKFIQKVAFFTPAREIQNVLEFDPNLLSGSLFGGDQA